MTCFCLTVTYIHITLEVRMPSICPTAGQMERKCKGPKYLILSALKFRIPLVLLSSILNLRHFPWYKHTLVLFMLVCSFSFSFLHLDVQPFLFLSYLMIIFYVLKTLCVLGVELSCRCQYFIYYLIGIFHLH